MKKKNLSKKVKRVVIKLPKPSKKELARQKKAKEFWSDSCWTNPLFDPEYTL